MSAPFHLKSINKSFGAITALNEIDLEVGQGEVIALIGPSGSGKTTLLKTLNAQHNIDAGSLNIHGKSISDLSHKQLRKLRSGIAYIPQDLGLVPNIKVFQNVLLGKVGQMHSAKMLCRFVFPPKAELENIHHLLERTGIAEKLYAETSTLSGGQKQRVAVTRALYQQAHTILADEPISSVDPARARSLVKLLIEIAKEHKLTLIMSMHNVELAKEFFPRLVGLKSGEILFDDKTEAVDKSLLDELYQLSDEQLHQ